MNSAATMSTLAATSRAPSGKSAVRKLRAQGQIPAVAYGKNLPATAVAVSPKDVLAILRSNHGKNSVIKLAVEGTDLLVMIREFSVHPVGRHLEHVDFVEVTLDQPVDVDIPLVYTGKAQGVVAGGIVRQVYRTLPVRCLPDRIPLKLEIDITHLKLTEHVSTRDLKLDEGITVRLPAEQTLIAVVAPEKERAEAVAAPGVPGAAAAPGAAAPAATAPAKEPKAAAPAKDAKKK